MSLNIDGNEYDGIAVSLSLDSEVQAHPVETGFDVADHVRHASPQFSISLTLGAGDTSRDTEYERLKLLRDRSTLFTFISDLGAFSDMIISNLSPAIERSENTYSCEVAITQIRQVALATATFDVVDKDGATLYSPDSPAGTPATQSLQEKDVDDEPEQVAGESWLSSIVSWVGGLF